jgi:hypothetical protein
MSNTIARHLCGGTGNFNCLPDERDVAAFDRQSDDPVAAVLILARSYMKILLPPRLTFSRFDHMYRAVYSCFSESHSKELRPFILR